MVTIYNPKTTNYKTTRLVSKATTSASSSVSEVEDREQEEPITEAKNGVKGPTGTVDVLKPAVKSDLTRKRKVESRWAISMKKTKKV